MNILCNSSVDMFSFLLGSYLEEELLGQGNMYVYLCKKLHNCFPK